MRLGSALAMAIIDFITLIYIFREGDEIVVFIIVAVFLMDIMTTTLATIGVFALKPHLILPLLGWYPVHTIVLCARDITYYAIGRKRIDNGALAGNITIDIIAYVSYIYFFFVFHSLYLHIMDKQKNQIRQNYDSDDDYDEEYDFCSTSDEEEPDAQTKDQPVDETKAIEDAVEVVIEEEKV